jgi:hypothetical protein
MGVLKSALANVLDYDTPLSHEKIAFEANRELDGCPQVRTSECARLRYALVSMKK